MIYYTNSMFFFNYDLSGQKQAYDLKRYETKNFDSLSYLSNYLDQAEHPDLNG